VRNVEANPERHCRRHEPGRLESGEEILERALAAGEQGMHVAALGMPARSTGSAGRPSLSRMSTRSK